jgi:catechol 2,3-dioxygenase-like lactoylglutathione lyase family enzyme
MFNPTRAFSGFSVNDLAAAKEFYSSKLGLRVDPDGVGARLHLTGGGDVFIYPKEDHQPASFTILNFEVEDIDAAVEELHSRGIELERYEDIPDVDSKGIMRGRKANTGPDIAWFLDPAGNVLSLLH